MFNTSKHGGKHSNKITLTDDGENENLSRQQKDVLVFSSSWERWCCCSRHTLAIFAVRYHFTWTTIFLGYLYAYFMMNGVNQTYGGLGYAVVYLNFGSLSSMMLASYMVRRFGSKWGAFICACLFAVCLPLVSVQPVMSSFLFFIFLSGAMYGLLEVSVIQGAMLTEIVSAKPLLGRYFAVSSFGSAVGMLTGQLLSANDIFDFGNVAALKVFFVVGILSLFLNIFAFYFMYDLNQEKSLLARLAACQQRANHPLLDRTSNSNVQNLLYASSNSAFDTFGVGGDHRLNPDSSQSRFAAVGYHPVRYSLLLDSCGVAFVPSFLDVLFTLIHGKEKNKRTTAFIIFNI